MTKEFRDLKEFITNSVISKEQKLQFIKDEIKNQRYEMNSQIIASKILELEVNKKEFEPA